MTTIEEWGGYRGGLQSGDNEVICLQLRSGAATVVASWRAAACSSLSAVISSRHDSTSALSPRASSAAAPRASSAASARPISSA
eukprot:1184019-Prorocentrum_minimum.AAC.2